MPPIALHRAAGTARSLRARTSRRRAAPAPQPVELLEPRIILSANGALFDTNEYVDFVGTGTIVDFEVGDLNGDGIADFVGTDRSQVHVVLSSRGGYIGMSSFAPATGTADVIQLADVQSDGDLDIVFVDTNGAGQVGYFLNDSFGNFGTSIHEVNTSDTDIRDFVAADFNRDGRLDVAFITADGYEIHTGNDSGSLAAQLLTSSTGSNRDFIAVRAADMNGDGTLDLVTQEYISNVFFQIGVLPIFANGSTGQFNRDVALSTSALTGFELLDLNNDGSIDRIAAVRADNAQLWHSENLTTGSNPEFDEANEQSVDSVLAGNGSEFLTSGDLNGDGVDDILLGTTTESGLQIFYGTPSQRHGGTYDTRTVLDTGNRPDRLVIADADNDGDNDIITYDGGEIFIHRNLGDGIFTSPEAATLPGQAQSSVDINPDDAAFGDLNGDGIVDAVVFNDFNNDLAVLYGSSLGRFTGQPTLTTSTITSIRDIAILDTDGDGDNDIVIIGMTASEGFVQVFRNDGIVPTSRGSELTNFTRLDAGRITGTTFSVPRIRVASLNGDAREDLVIGDGSNDRFIVLTGETNGSMSLVGRFGTGDDVQDIAVADMDLDGDMDIIVATDVGLSVIIEEGQFNYDSMYTRFVDGGVDALAVDHFNPDTLPDVATISGDGYGELTFYRNRSPISDAIVLKPIASTVLDLGSVNIGRILVADLDNDGDNDLTLDGDSSIPIVAVLSDGFLGVQSAQHYEDGRFERQEGVGLVDVDGDGDHDLLAVSFASTGQRFLNVHHNLGDGIFHYPAPPTSTFQRVGVAPSGSVGRSVTGNFNGNARPEFATFEFDEHSGNDLVSVYLPSEDGILRLATIDLGSDQFSSQFAAGDINGDGRDDLLVYNSTERRYYTLINNGNGTAWTMTLAHSQSDFSYSQVALGDLTGDGIVDILAFTTSGQSGDNQFILMPGKNDGTFRNGNARIILSPGSTTSSLDAPPLIVDFDGDGRNDIVVPDDDGSGSVRLIQQTAPGTFATPDTFLGTGIDPSAISVADVNSDGRPDILVGLESSSAYFIVFNTSTPGTPEHNFVAFSTEGFQTSGGVYAADIDNDGRLELVASSSSGLTVIEINVAGAAIARTSLTYSFSSFRPFHLIDLNRDGATDMLGTFAQSINSAFLDVELNRLSGRPNPANSLPTIPTGTIHLGDLDAFADTLALSFRRLRNIAAASDADGDRLQGFRITEIVDAELSGKGGIVNGGRYFVFGETIDYVLTSDGLSTAFKVTLFDGKGETVAIYDVTYNGIATAMMAFTSPPPPPPVQPDPHEWLDSGPVSFGLFDADATEAPTIISSYA